MPDDERAIIDKLVLANRILAHYGVVDGFGHVSVRGAGPDTFLLSRSLAPATVTAADIMRFDLDGQAQGGDSRRPYLERFIHGEIYRVRDDVMSVVHNHSPSVIPFGATRQPLKPLYHMSSFIGAGTPIFEIREAGGNTDLLVRDNRLGAALARSLGEASVVLMRGHGCTVVGTTLEQAVYRAIYTEMNARLQREAHALGTPDFLNEEEAAKASATMDATMSRAWDLWVAEIAAITRDRD
jgi:HCOMODA/2-hydroxy-3-carboxy-muconic semialdehyde decarboxylase